MEFTEASFLLFKPKKDTDTLSLTRYKITTGTGFLVKILIHLLKDG